MPYTRIQTPVSVETYEMLQKLADARKCSLAAVCRDLIEQTAPVAEQLTEALTLAHEAPARAMREMNKVAEEQLSFINEEMSKIVPKIKKRRKAG